MYAVIQGDRITFRSTIRARAEGYRDEHGGLLYQLLYCDAEIAAETAEHCEESQSESDE